jgi:hypothetical protein
LTPEDFGADHDLIEVWPENEQAVVFFAAIGAGAWNVGPGGPIGIRPEAMREIRLALGINAAQWRGGLFLDVAVMEAEALKTMKEQAKT